MYTPEELVKVHIDKTEEVHLFWYRPSEYSLTAQVGVETGDDTITDDDFTELEPKVADYLEMAHQRFEAANYHSEFRRVEEAIQYMSDEKAIEYLKQVETP